MKNTNFYVLEQDWEDFVEQKSSKCSMEIDFEKLKRELKINIHLMAKHNNRKKIESHYWFFEGFCEYT